MFWLWCRCESSVYDDDDDDEEEEEDVVVVEEEVSLLSILVNILVRGFFCVYVLNAVNVRNQDGQERRIYDRRNVGSLWVDSSLSSNIQTTVSCQVIERQKDRQTQREREMLMMMMMMMIFEAYQTKVNHNRVEFSVCFIGDTLFFLSFHTEKSEVLAWEL